MNNQRIAKELQDLKAKAEQAGLDLAKHEGSLKVHKDRLLKEFGINTVKAGQAEIARLTKQIEAADEDIRKRYEELMKDTLKW